MAFTFDPRQASLSEILNPIRKKLMKIGLTLELLRTMNVSEEMDTTQ